MRKLRAKRRKEALAQYSKYSSKKSSRGVSRGLVNDFFASLIKSSLGSIKDVERLSNASVIASNTSFGRVFNTFSAFLRFFNLAGGKDFKDLISKNQNILGPLLTFLVSLSIGAVLGRPASQKILPNEEASKEIFKILTKGQLVSGGIAAVSGLVGLKLFGKITSNIFDFFLLYDKKSSTLKVIISNFMSAIIGAVIIFILSFNLNTTVMIQVYKKLQVETITLNSLKIFFQQLYTIKEIRKLKPKTIDMRAFFDFLTPGNKIQSPLINSILQAAQSVPIPETETWKDLAYYFYYQFSAISDAITPKSNFSNLMGLIFAALMTVNLTIQRDYFGKNTNPNVSKILKFADDDLVECMFFMRKSVDVIFSNFVNSTKDPIDQDVINMSTKCKTNQDIVQKVLLANQYAIEKRLTPEIMKKFITSLQEYWSFVFNENYQLSDEKRIIVNQSFDIFNEKIQLLDLRLGLNIVETQTEQLPDETRQNIELQNAQNVNTGETNTTTPRNQVPAISIGSQNTPPVAVVQNKPKQTIIGQVGSIIQSFLGGNTSNASTQTGSSMIPPPAPVEPVTTNPFSDLPKKNVPLGSKRQQISESESEDLNIPVINTIVKDEPENTTPQDNTNSKKTPPTSSVTMTNTATGKTVTSVLLDSNSASQANNFATQVSSENEPEQYFSDDEIIIDSQENNQTNQTNANQTSQVNSSLETGESVAIDKNFKKIKAIDFEDAMKRIQEELNEEKIKNRDLRENYNTLKTNFDNRENSLQNVLQELAQEKLKNTNLQGAYDSLKTKTDKLEKDLQDCETNNIDLSAKLAALQTNFDDASNLVTSLQSDYDSLNSTYQQFMESQNGNNEISNEIIDNLTSEKTGLQSRLQSSLDEKSKVEAELNTLKIENQNLKNAEATFQNLKTRLETIDIKSLEDIAVVAKKIDDCKKLNVENQVLKNFKSELANLLQSSQDNVFKVTENLLKDIGLKQQDINLKSERIENLAKQLASLNEKEQQLDNTIVERNTEIQTLKDRIQELSENVTEKTTLITQKQKVEEELTKLKNTHTDLDKLYKDAVKEKDAIITEKNKALVEITQAKATILEKDTTIASITTKASQDAQTAKDAFDNTFSNLNEQITQLKKSIETLNNQKAELQQKIDQFEPIKASTASQIREFELKIDSLQADNVILRDKNEKLADSIANLRQAMANDKISRPTIASMMRANSNNTSSKSLQKGSVKGSSNNTASNTPEIPMETTEDLEGKINSIIEQNNLQFRENEKLQASLDSLSTRLDKKETEIKEKIAEINNLKRSLESTKQESQSEIQKLTSEKSILDQENSGLKKTEALLKSQLEKANGLTEKESQKFLDSQKAYDFAKNKITELTEQIGKLNEEKSKLEIDYKDLKTNFEKEGNEKERDLSQKITDIETKFKEKNNKYAALKADHDRNLKIIKENDKLQKSLTSTLKEKDANIKDCEQSLIKKDSLISELQNEKNRLQNENSQLLQKNKSVDQEKGEFEQQKSAFEERLKTLTEENNKLTLFLSNQQAQQPLSLEKDGELVILRISVEKLKAERAKFFNSYNEYYSIAQKEKLTRIRLSGELAEAKAEIEELQKKNPLLPSEASCIGLKFENQKFKKQVQLQQDVLEELGKRIDNYVQDKLKNYNEAEYERDIENKYLQLENKELKKQIQVVTKQFTTQTRDYENLKIVYDTAVTNANEKLTKVGQLPITISLSADQVDNFSKYSDLLQRIADYELEIEQLKNSNKTLTDQINTVKTDYILNKQKSLNLVNLYDKELRRHLNSGLEKDYAFAVKSIGELIELLNNYPTSFGQTKLPETIFLQNRIRELEKSNQNLKLVIASLNEHYAGNLDYQSKLSERLNGKFPRIDQEYLNYKKDSFVEYTNFLISKNVSKPKNYDILRWLIVKILLLESQTETAKSNSDYKDLIITQLNQVFQNNLSILNNWRAKIKEIIKIEENSMQFFDQNFIPVDKKQETFEDEFLEKIKPLTVILQDMENQIEKIVQYKIQDPPVILTEFQQYFEAYDYVKFYVSNADKITDQDLYRLFNLSAPSSELLLQIDGFFEKTKYLTFDTQKEVDELKLKLINILEQKKYLGPAQVQQAKQDQKKKNDELEKENVTLQETKPQQSFFDSWVGNIISVIGEGVAKRMTMSGSGQNAGKRSRGSQDNRIDED